MAGGGAALGAAALKPNVAFVGGPTRLGGVGPGAAPGVVVGLGGLGMGPAALGAPSAGEHGDQLGEGPHGRASLCCGLRSEPSDWRAPESWKESESKLSPRSRVRFAVNERMLSW